MTNKLAIIGGSGLYDIEEFKEREFLDIKTPWGKPSDKILKAKFNNIPDNNSFSQTLPFPSTNTNNVNINFNKIPPSNEKQEKKAKTLFFLMKTLKNLKTIQSPKRILYTRSHYANKNSMHPKSELPAHHKSTSSTTWP